MNKDYLDPDNLSSLNWKFIDAKPFEHIFLENFLSDESAIEMADALKKEEFEYKESDLFQFKQTKDFSSIASGKLKEFYDHLASEEFAEFIRKLTGVNVKQSALDVSGSLYENTDYLLCHDDQVSDRKIAYILYLGENFSARDGGSFNLLSSSNGKPKEVTKKFYPKFNGLMVFRVSDKSFHEVEEVIGKKKRYAIGGWLK